MEDPEYVQKQNEALRDGRGDNVAVREWTNETQ
jgi:hypothetical protein